MSQGYLQEIFSSFQGEGAAIEGSTYGLRQIFIRFTGCPLAIGVHGTNGCIWCDSPKAKSMKTNYCSVENKAGSQNFKRIANPISSKEVIKIIKSLTTPDLHSISLTGGEPLYQNEFLEEIIKELKTNDYKIFLETAYTDDLLFLQKIAPLVDYACVDLKEKSAKAALNWKMLLEQEYQMCKILRKAKTKVFAKTVITKTSKKEDFEIITELCGKLNIPIAIQLVSPIEGKNIERPTWEQVQEFTKIAAKYLKPEKIGISVQMHKCINIL